MNSLRIQSRRIERGNCSKAEFPKSRQNPSRDMRLVLLVLARETHSGNLPSRFALRLIPDCCRPYSWLSLYFILLPISETSRRGEQPSSSLGHPPPPGRIAVSDARHHSVTPQTTFVPNPIPGSHRQMESHPEAGFSLHRSMPGCLESFVGCSHTVVYQSTAAKEVPTGSRSLPESGPSTLPVLLNSRSHR